METKNNQTRITISLLWISVMFLMIFADIFSIIIELNDGDIMQIPMEVKTAMTIAAIVTALPILMVILSWVLPYKINRLANMIVGILSIIYVIGGGTSLPFYIIMAGIEVILLITIIVISMKWEKAQIINQLNVEL